MRRDQGLDQVVESRRRRVGAARRFLSSLDRLQCCQAGIAGAAGMNRRGRCLGHGLGWAFSCVFSSAVGNNRRPASRTRGIDLHDVIRTATRKSAPACTGRPHLTIPELNRLTWVRGTATPDEPGSGRASGMDACAFSGCSWSGALSGLRRDHPLFRLFGTLESLGPQRMTLFAGRQLE